MIAPPIGTTWRMQLKAVAFHVHVRLIAQEK